MTVTFIGDADVLDWLKAATDDPAVDAWKFSIETATRDIERYRSELLDIRSGVVVVMPASIAHAKAMHLVAERYLEDNRSI